MKKLILFLLVSLSFSFFQKAEAQGSVTETVEPQVTKLMNRFVRLNRATTAVPGWRIQILATTDRQKMEEALRQFQYLYPSVAADWVHAKPYFKIRAGAFTSKRDAMQTLYILKQDYPAAYPVQDPAIRPEELLK